MQPYNQVWKDYKQSLELFLKKCFGEKISKLFPIKLQKAKLPGYLFDTPVLIAFSNIAKIKMTDLIANFEKYYQENPPSDFEVVLGKKGFINLKITSKAYQELLLKLLTSSSNKIPLNPDKFLGNQTERIVIDYSSPNIAKELHVGHLRSTIIGESIARLFEYQGCQVLRRNHLGDWGMPLGMLIEYILDQGIDRQGFSLLTIKELGKYYSLASQKSKADEEFKKRAKERTFKIQKGDPESQELYQIIYQTSLVEINKIYRLLNVNPVVQGESFYHLRMIDLVLSLTSDELYLKKHVQVENDTGLKLFFPTESKFPLVLEKSGGGFTYDTSDLSALKYRLSEVKASKVIYVVDSGQEDHLKNIFQAGRDLDWIKDYQDVVHLKFGLVLGNDGKKLSSRNFYQQDQEKESNKENNKENNKASKSDELALSSFLDKAIKETGNKFYARYLKSVNNNDVDGRITEEEYLDQNREQIATIAISSIKFQEFCKAHQTNCKFDFQEMLVDQGKTALHINYTYARLLSIYKKIESSQHISREQALRKIKEYLTSVESESELESKIKENQELIIGFGQFNSMIEKATQELELHFIGEYLFHLSNLIDNFYQNCRVIRENKESQYQIDYFRLSLVEISIRMIETLAWILNLDLALYV